MPETATPIPCRRRRRRRRSMHPCRTRRIWSNHSRSSAASSGTLVTLKGPSYSGLGVNSKSSMSPPTTSLGGRRQGAGRGGVSPGERARLG
jgi:hypothetical protein